MRIFAQKPKVPHSNMSDKPSVPERAYLGPNHQVDSIHHVQSTTAQPVLQRSLATTTGSVTGAIATTETAHFGHDFSQIPVYSTLPLQIQAKLTVSTPGDQYEQEADQVANAVMAGYSRRVGHISQGVQPKLYRLELRPEDLVDSVFPLGGESEAGSPETSPTEEVQRSAVGATGAVPAHFEQSLQQATHGGGDTLPAATRSFMENRFGYDFSAVRVHTDTRAHTLAQAINARAFTLNKDIFFARSQYQPDNQAGQYLLAHELTHVVQQSEHRLSRHIQRQTSCSSYSGYNSSVDLNTYNCAGLATRTYQFISPPSAVYSSIASNFIGPHTPTGGTCHAGAVKFWLWEYDMHAEDDQGTVLSPAGRDFHIVAGRTDAITAADPTDVYTKNGRRRVYGPGTGPSFRPATRERALSNDPSETPLTHQGRPVFKVRSNMSEHISCADCHP